MKILLSSILIKVALFIIPLSLLKILSDSLLAQDFSNFFILFNISAYLYAFIFSLPAISLLRFYHHRPFKDLSAFTKKIFIYSTMIILMTILLASFFNFKQSVINIISVSILSSGIGYFTFTTNIFRSNQFLVSLMLFHFLLLTLIIISFLNFSKKLEIAELIILLGLIYWFVAISKRLFLKKNHPFFLEKKFALKLDIFKSAYFKYAFPLAIVGLTNSLIASSNQLILRFFVSANDLAGYISAFIIAEKLFFSVQSLIVFIFLPILYKKFNTLNFEAINYVKRLSIMYFFLAVFICISSIFFRDTLIILLSNTEFLEYSWIIPVIGIGLIFLGVSSLLAEIFLISQNSIIVMKIYLWGFIVNLVLNIIFIPIFGIYGAISGTIISNIAVLVFSIIKLKSLIGVEIKN